MQENNSENHSKCTTRFIELANQMKEEGMPIELVSAALMSASGIYATYTVAGNEGGLESSGVDKVVNTYKRNLENIQRIKREQYGR